MLRNNEENKVQDFKNENLWLMKGDCLERMKEIPDGSVDRVFTCPIAQPWYNQHVIMRLG